MNKWKKKLTKKERCIYASVISVFFVILSLLFTYLKPLNTLDYIVSDFFYQYLAEKKESDSNIKIIAIDEKTVSRIGKFEKWSRSQTARLINYLNSGKDGPDVIALGLDYHDEKDTQGDNALVEVCKEYGNICVSSVLEVEQNNNKKKSSDVLYIPSSLPDTDTEPVSVMVPQQSNSIMQVADSMLGDSSTAGETGLPTIPAGTVSGQKIKDIIMPFDGLIPYVTTGIINISKSDYNGDVRGMVASVGHKGKEYDSFPLAVYKMYLKENGKKFRAPDTGPDNSFGINYSKNKKNYEVYSFYDVICGSVDKSKFNNSIVLISDYTTSSTFSIPNYKSLKLSEIELQANVINALLHNNTIHYASRWFLALWYSIFAVIFFLVTFHSSGLGTIFYSIGIIAFQILACCMTNVWGYYIPLLRIVMLIIIIAIVNFIVSYIVIKKQQYTMEKVFKKYVDEQVVNEIKEGGFDVSIGGTRKDIAVLFVDIRGFTPLSEKLSPENVVDILNSYLTIIANAVAANGGTLDKFIGDAAMAVFNSPSDLEDYVFRAVCTAWDILSNEENLRKECLEKYGREVEFGIGINCGDAVIGNIGSQNRMEYTAIGDTVNTTSRLEGVAEPGQILISREVAKRLGSRIDVSFAGEYSLKGKKRKVVAYEVNGILEQYEPVVKRDKTISEIYEDSIKEIKKVQEKCITNVQAIKELAGKEKGGIKEAGGKGIEIWGNKDHKTASIAKGGK